MKTGVKRAIIIEPVTARDYKSITKQKYWFDWKTERRNLVYKLRLKDQEEILGLISLLHVEEEQRFEIHLLSVSKENRGRKKIYEGIAGSLIAYACREAVKRYAEKGCVSLIPKTELKPHYMKKYGMLSAGWQLFLEGVSLLRLLEKYEL